MKVLVNRCYGGYGNSKEAGREWLKRTDTTYKVLEDDYSLIVEVDGQREYMNHIDRTDPVLIQIFEEKGSEFVSGPHAQLDLQEIPDGCEYEIGEYDGQEWIDETWITISIEELKNGLSEDRLALAQRVTCIRVAHEPNDTMQ
jgi:hypothetical protein